jgi:hypothetical protein
LENYASIRKEEISAMAEPYVRITDRYGRLVSRLVLILGSREPVDTQDIVIRDLMADIFDCLYESRSLILEGKLNVAFPIARRAYESLSLLHVCTLDASWAEKWSKGKKIGNADIRKELAAHPMGEAEQEMKDLYNFFCSATHPNRELTPRRFLGEGNEFVLGAIGAPDLVMVSDFCIKNLEMWFWLTATITYFYRKTVDAEDCGYFDTYRQSAKEAQEVRAWLVDNFNRLLAEAQEYWENNPVE